MTIEEYRKLVIKTVHCPCCLAAPGEQCFNDGGNVGYVHDNRSLALDLALYLV